MRFPSRRVTVMLALAALVVGTLGWPAAVGATDPTVAGASDRYVVVAKSVKEFEKLRADAIRAGAMILKALPDLNMLVVRGTRTARDRIAASPNAQGIAKDSVKMLIEPDGYKLNASPTLNKRTVDVSKINGVPDYVGDPAFGYPGLMWNIERIRAPQAWRITKGSPNVVVGVADTGLDFTHSELAGRIIDVVDLTVNEDPPLCDYYFGESDASLAAYYGVPELATTDWNGHGTWIGGTIAANLDGVGVTGIAPNVSLVALKISQWCGYAYSSTILDAFLYAANHGIGIVSISFGGYDDLTDPEQAFMYEQYKQAVAYAMARGTVIVASAGNEHLRIGAGGKVLSHGYFNAPGDPPTDYYGLYDTPAGIPGVVMVSATGNVVARASSSCPPGRAPDLYGNPTCKPTSDLHQPYGAGKQDQLAYYSNYGPRTDVAAPGGARKFNLARWDGGGTPGFPYTFGMGDGYTSYETFGITSNWAMEIPCWVLHGFGFYEGECYSNIQGTSMATPHASAVAALIASVQPKLRHNAWGLVAALKGSTRMLFDNRTPPLSASDTSQGDLDMGAYCASGYCHMGGMAIPFWEAYGAGIVDAYRGVMGYWYH